MGTLLEGCYSRGLQRFQASKPDKKLKRSGLYALVPLSAALNHLPLTPHRKLPKSLGQIDMATPPPTPDWAGLPDDALLTVFKRLGASEVLLGTAVVCRNWLRVATGEPDLWRRGSIVIDWRIVRHPTTAIALGISKMYMWKTSNGRPCPIVPQNLFRHSWSTLCSYLGGGAPRANK